MEGLQNEYDKIILKGYHNNIMQIIYSLIGILSLFISTKLDGTVFKEIVLIGGWVFIWSMLELEIFTDIKIRRKRKVLEKLLSSEIVEFKSFKN